MVRLMILSQFFISFYLLIFDAHEYYRLTAKNTEKKKRFKIINALVTD